MIYFFNAVSKNGPTGERTALYYILHMDGKSPNPVWCRERVLRQRFCSSATLVVEGLAAPLIMSPIGVTWCRRVAVVSLIGLHIGIALWMNVGLFSWACLRLSPLTEPAGLRIGHHPPRTAQRAPLSIQLREQVVFR